MNPIAKPTAADFQESLVGFLKTFDKTSENKLNNLFKTLGYNMEFIPQFYLSIKALHTEVYAEPRQAEAVKEKVTDFIRATNTVIGSQKGFENFLTDETKKNDLTMKVFYDLHATLVSNAEDLITKPEGADEFFTPTAGTFYGSLAVTVATLSEKAKLVSKVTSLF